MDDLVALPGGDLVEAGLRDLALGRETERGLLVAVATTRLRQLGIAVPEHPFTAPEHRLYDLLGRQDPTDAYGRYNALLRRLASFIHALEHEGARRARGLRG
jgi:hypothetical protein